MKKKEGVQKTYLVSFIFFWALAGVFFFCVATLGFKHFKRRHSWLLIGQTLILFIDQRNESQLHSLDRDFG